MKSKFFQVALSLLIIFISTCSSNQQHIPIKWPEIESESVVDAYQNLLISLANTKLNVTALPRDAQEDGRDIMTELRENLDECRSHLMSDHLLWQYKVCVHQQLDTSDNRIWDLINSLSRERDDDDDDDDSGAGKLTALLPAVIASVLAFRHLL